MSNKATEAISIVREEIERIKSLHPVRQARLADDGAIIYANGNDTTEFDWENNGRLCEFVIFYDTGRGYIVSKVYSAGGIISCVYRRNRLLNTSPKAEYQAAIDPNLVSALKNALVKLSDEQKKWDCSIDELDWDSL